jgi:hypothetical protein
VKAADPRSWRRPDALRARSSAAYHALILVRAAEAPADAKNYYEALVISLSCTCVCCCWSRMVRCHIRARTDSALV